MTASFVAAAVPRLDGSEGDGIHLLWTAPSGAGYSIGGWDIQRRAARGRPKVRCTQLTADQLELLHRVLRLHTPVADIVLRQAACPVAPAAPAPAPVAPAPVAIGTAPGPRGCAAYEITLPQCHRVVQVRAGVPAALAIALRAGKAVAARELAAPTGTQSARFENRDVDQVILYVADAVTSLEICVDEPPDPRVEEAEWAGEPFIARGLQVPIRALDPGLGSAAEEEALARSRLLPADDLDADGFAAVAELMNAAAAGVQHTAPVLAGTVTREEPDDPYLELRSWSYALAVLVEPAWRRALGFGLLDAKGDLTPGNSYDYRIIGRFRRRDVEERVHGFHAVPRGTTLPSAFALGPLSLLTAEPAVVEQRPEPAAGALQNTGRKGIRLEGDPCLTLSFPAPVTSVVLELDAGAALRWNASTTEFLLGLPLATHGAALPADRRVTIEPTQPVDTIVLSGSGFLFGVREVLAAPGVDSDEVVTGSMVLHGVVFQDTPLLEPPAALETENLQEPTLPVGATAAPPMPPRALGFRLSWPPPPASASGVVAWPPDLGALPPFDALGFRIERRRADTAGPFEPLDHLVYGSRGARADPPALRPGTDLEAAFPEHGQPVPPVSIAMSIDDVLVNAEHEGPPPGSTHQYRIFSVDVLGRPSASHCLGPVVRLEQHQPPPRPVGPAAAPAAGAIVPPGVRARVLQAADPDLPPDDRALLDSSDDAVVLEWGWTQRERDADPHATEFRVYWQSQPPDVIGGAVTGTATLVNGLFEMAATLERPLAADAMRGRYLPLPDHPFRVASHTAGHAITLRLEPSELDPAPTPAPARLEFRPALDGSEQRPPAWEQRAAIVPITAEETYNHVFRDVLVLDAEQPRARVWVGVSSADDQDYVADALAAAMPNGGRPGNESAVVVAPAAARYLGRPELTVPPPLPDVPEIVTDEPAGETVTVVVDLPALLPAVPVPAGHRITLERLSLDRIVAAMSARPDDTIGAALPDGTATSYTVANPTDHADLLAQIRTGTPARVEGRFLMDFLLRFGARLEPLWQAALPEPVALGALTDTLPAKAERHVHRIRLVDAAGHVSAGAAIPEQIVRVASLRAAGPPELRAVAGQAGGVNVTVRVREAFDLAHVVVFAATEDAGPPPNGNLRAAAQLLRLANRRDLYPDDGIRVRLADTTLLAPAAVLEVDGGRREPPDRVLTATLAPGDDKRVALWSVALTRDGIPSRLTGPVIALTGPPPLAAPALAVTAADGTDTVQFTAVQALLALERSTDGGATWRRITPWLAAGTTTYSLPSAAGAVRYRAAMRASRGRRAVGPEVTPT